MGFNYVWNLRNSTVPEPVDVRLRHQVLDEKEAVFLVEEPLLRGQCACIKWVSVQQRGDTN